MATNTAAVADTTVANTTAANTAAVDMISHCNRAAEACRGDATGGSLMMPRPARCQCSTRFDAPLMVLCSFR
jgi:hypothetical protein